MDGGYFVQVFKAEKLEQTYWKQTEAEAVALASMLLTIGQAERTAIYAGAYLYSVGPNREQQW
jgi:hypothetical protein